MESHQQAGAEVRRLNIIYFLSRNGRIEHPHLIRVHQLTRNGVHLRDVKRWLAELRGKDLPESYAWSYKRRYKGGYVWQDLLDEDLITPISDNEYVLKGSKISSSLLIEEEDSNMGNKLSVQKQKEANTDSYQEVEDLHPQEPVQTKMSPQEEISEELDDSQTFASDKSSTLTDDNQEFSSSTDASSKQQEEIKVKKMSKKAKAGSDNVGPEGKPSTPSATPRPSFSKNKSYTKHGASHLFKNLITCGAIDTNDSVMVSINRGSKTSSTSNEVNTSGMLQKADKIGGSQRVMGTKLMLPRQVSGRKSFDGVRPSSKNSRSESENKSPNPAYMPIYGPKCSQCGKHFNPEKLHSHMKSCKGMKNWAKNHQENLNTTRFQATC